MEPEVKPEKAKPPKKLKLKKAKSPKKPKLEKETLRELTDEEAAKVAGGQKSTACGAPHPV